MLKIIISGCNGHMGRVVESPAAGSCRDGRGMRGVLHADRPSVGQSRRPAP